MFTLPEIRWGCSRVASAGISNRNCRIGKRSGSKGMQVYLPLNGDVTYDDTKPYAHAVAKALE